VRGAYGIHYNLSALAPSEGLYFNAPYFELRAFLPSADAPILLHDPFPQQGAAFVPQSATAFQRDLRTPYLHQFNVNVQRQLGPSRVVEVGYVGSRGRNLISGRDLNQPAPSALPLNLRPNPLFGDVTYIESRARSRYDSLQVRFEQRLDGGRAMLAAYTLGRSEDDASAFFPSGGDPNFPQDSHNPAAEWARSNFDVRHRLSVSLSQELPWDLQVAGVVTLQSGRPFTVALLPEVDNSNTGRSVLGLRRQRPARPLGRRVDRRSLTRTVVRDDGLFDAGLRDVRQRRPQHPRRPRVRQRQRGGDQACAVRRRPAAPAPGGGVQPAQPGELRSAGQLLRVADLRSRAVGRSAATRAARRAAALLTRLRRWRRGASRP
jgi:hypothetical protein